MRIDELGKTTSANSEVADQPLPESEREALALPSKKREESSKIPHTAWVAFKNLAETEKSPFRVDKLQTGARADPAKSESPPCVSMIN